MARAWLTIFLMAGACDATGDWPSAVSTGTSVATFTTVSICHMGRDKRCLGDGKCGVHARPSSSQEHEAGPHSSTDRHTRNAKQYTKT